MRDRCLNARCRAASRRPAPSARSIVQPGHHFVPNDVGEGGLGATGDLGRRAVGTEDDGFVLGAPEDPSPADRGATVLENEACQ